MELNDLLKDNFNIKRLYQIKNAYIKLKNQKNNIEIKINNNKLKIQSNKYNQELYDINKNLNKFYDCYIEPINNIIINLIQDDSFISSIKCKNCNNLSPLVDINFNCQNTDNSYIQNCENYICIICIENLIKINTKLNIKQLKCNTCKILTNINKDIYKCNILTNRLLDDYIQQYYIEPYYNFFQEKLYFINHFDQRFSSLIDFYYYLYNNKN